MSLKTVSQVVRVFIDSEPLLSIALKNLAAGVCDKLFLPRDVRRLRIAAGLHGKSAYAGLASLSGDDLMSEINLRVRRTRFQLRPVPFGTRVTPDVGMFPAFAPASPDLDAVEIARVIDHRTLHGLISDRDRFRFRKLLPIGYPSALGMRSDVEPWITAIGALPEPHRRFRLADGKAISRGIVWFLTHGALQRFRAAAAPANHAAYLRDLLGLVHLPELDPSTRAIQPTWLFLLRFPGRIIQDVGHYRPSFADALDNRRFLATSTVPGGAPGGSWGQTADLERIDAGAASFDGAQERVTHQLHASDFARRRISFELLGELTTVRGTIRDIHAPSDSAFARIIP